MISQRLLRTLLFSLSIVLALFVVTAGARTLFAAGGDAPTAQVLHWISLILLLVVVADVLLLVIALALYTIEPPVSRRGDESSEQAHQE